MRRSKAWGYTAMEDSKKGRVAHCNPRQCHPSVGMSLSHRTSETSSQDSPWSREQCEGEKDHGLE